MSSPLHKQLGGAPAFEPGHVQGRDGRVKTGIAELDTMLRGGFMEGDAVLIAGTAGSGKTTLALQYLVNGIKYDEPGVYVTFEQLPVQIYRDAKNFGWDLRQLEDDDKFRIICTSPNLMLESSGETILDEVLDDIQPRRVVIDSLSHLEMFVEKRSMRKEAYQLINFLKTKGMSSILIWESSPIAGSGLNVTEMGLSFLVDCIVALKPVEIESSLRKAVMILKMRGSDHDKQLREFEITSNGVKITSSFANYEGLMTGAPRKVASDKFFELMRRESEKEKKK
jgi:circadian clock protein KaiC